MTPEARLAELGLRLPDLPGPIGNFVSWRRAGRLLYLSGQGPRDAAGTVSVGRVGRDCTVERAYDDARLVGLRILATIRQALGSIDHIEAMVKIFGMVHAEPDFTDHSKVINGCSDLLVDVLGERGRHARSAVGMASLPDGMTVEIETIVQIADGH